MLKIPIDCYNILDVLKLNHYKLVLQLLSYRERHTVCMYIINSILDKETIIPTADEVSDRRRSIDLFDWILCLGDTTVRVTSDTVGRPSGWLVGSRSTDYHQRRFRRRAEPCCPSLQQSQSSERSWSTVSHHQNLSGDVQRRWSGTHAFHISTDHYASVRLSFPLQRHSRAGAWTTKEKTKTINDVLGWEMGEEMSKTLSTVESIDQRTDETRQ